MDACTPLNFNSYNFSNSCQYITYFNGCSSESGIINYFQLQYCVFNNRWAPTILMFLWFLFLLTGIATAADGFLAPCLVVVAKTMRMSENLTGVTLLALGNGAADVFSSLAAVVSASNPNVGLSFGGILGAAIFVNSITAGIIMIISPFKIMQRPIIKDLSFYFLALIWCMFIFIRKEIELWSSLVFLIIYAIYILVTVISRLLYVRNNKSKMSDIQTNDINISITTPSLDIENKDNVNEIISESSSISDFVAIYQINRSRTNLNLSVSNIEITVTSPDEDVNRQNSLNKVVRKSSSISDFVHNDMINRSRKSHSLPINNIGITITSPAREVNLQKSLDECIRKSSSISDFMPIDLTNRSRKSHSLPINNIGITITSPAGEVNLQKSFDECIRKSSSISDFLPIDLTKRSRKSHSLPINNIGITVTSPDREINCQNSLNKVVRKSSSIPDFTPFDLTNQSGESHNLPVNNIEIIITSPAGAVNHPNNFDEFIRKTSSISDFNGIYVGKSNSKTSNVLYLKNSNIYAYDNPNYIPDNTANYISSTSTAASSFNSNLTSIYGNKNLMNKDKLDHLNVLEINQSRKSEIDTQKNSFYHEPECYVNKRNIGDFLNVHRFERFYDSFRSSIRSAKSSVDGNNQKCSCPVKRRQNSNKNSIMRSMSHRSIGSLAKIIIENEHEKERMEKNTKPKKSSLIRSVSLKILNEIEPKTKIRFWSMNEDTKSKSNTNNHKKDEIDHTNDEENKYNIDENNSSNDATVTFPGTWKHFAWKIVPLDIEEWREQSVFSKIISIIQTPFMFILTLTIPIVDESAFLNGWCKVLNCIHCLLSPFFWILLINVYLTSFGSSKFLLTHFFLILGFISGVVVAFKSKVDKPPIYHSIFAFIGLITSILWIYKIANEIVSILTTFGVVLNISEVILGLSVLAFANSVGDLVSNVTLAKNNYPRIGYSACIGGPLFNLLIGIGLPFSIKTVKGPVKIPLVATSIVLIFTIMFITLLNLICIPLMKFHPKRFYGIILICIYAVFFVLVILFAANVINVPL